VKVHIFGIPKCLQQCENVDTIEVDIYNIIYNIKMYPCSLKRAQTGNAVKMLKVRRVIDVHKR
jgi:hypothetical protein